MKDMVLWTELKDLLRKKGAALSGCADLGAVEMPAAGGGGVPEKPRFPGMGTDNGPGGAGC